MRNRPFQYDFRSDTVTQPCRGMLAAMASADLGDDVFGDDPTVQALERRTAAMTGKAAALFLPSGTQSNLAGLMAHCARGEEYLVGQQAHCYKYEGGGAAVLGSIQPQPIAHQPDGSIALADIEAAIKVDDSHFAISKLLALENTTGGKVLSLSYMREATALARRYGLSSHLDGARVFNAATALGVDVATIAGLFDSVSICLSKGLGAPVGSVLVGSEPFIARARRVRKMLGGGMRQVGVLAAAGLYALDNNIDRLSEDHDLARIFADGLTGIKDLCIVPPQTNMIFVDLAPERVGDLQSFLAARGVGVAGTYGQLRLVTHLDVDREAIDKTIDFLQEWANQ